MREEHILFHLDNHTNSKKNQLITKTLHMFIYGYFNISISCKIDILSSFSSCQNKNFRDDLKYGLIL